MPTTTIARELTRALGKLTPPIATLYSLGIELFRIYQRAAGAKTSYQVRLDVPRRRQLNIQVKHLLDEGIIDYYPGFPGRTVFGLLGGGTLPPEVVACAVDPFCYVSHLSAMEFYGLTNRIPRTLFLTTSKSSEWRDHAEQKMRSDTEGKLQLYLDAGLPKLRRTRFDRIGQHAIHRRHASYLGAFRHVEDRHIRVTTVGRTFLDMLKDPELCGGIHHVIEVFSENAERHRKSILNEIDRHGAPIDKVRAGFILEEETGISDPVIDGWQSFAQRGGSRKLDPGADYQPVWSERWCLSINV